ncbi:MAG: hypothetical protein LBJ57_05890 [Prevotellaceae bacterium]|jgi:hypothetical protein|nr:hypothetical protein [Prevotellaceae bacterium]
MEQKESQCTATELTLDKRNYRRHSDANKELIKKSLTECGAGRSIVVDRDNVIVAGNGVFEQASALGLTVRVVESDGTELIAIKRTDLTTTDERRKLLAMADNRTSDTSTFDLDLLADDFDIDTLGEWDFTFDADVGVKNDPAAEFDAFGEFSYANKDCTAKKTLIVHFDSEDDFRRFLELTGLPITSKTRSTYFPFKEKEKSPEAYE